MKLTFSAIFTYRKTPREDGGYRKSVWQCMVSSGPLRPSEARRLSSRDSEGPEETAWLEVSEGGELEVSWTEFWGGASLK